MENGLGRMNGGVVFAQFSRAREEEGELSMREGERFLVLDSSYGETAEQKWWTVKNGQDMIGEVPSTFLGLYKQVRKSDIL